MSVSKSAARFIGTWMLLLSATNYASAASIEFTLNCDIVGPTCTPVTSKGTLTITDSTDNANWVDVVLDLVSGDPQTFLFNFTGFPLPAGYTFEANGTTIDVEEDGLQADGYTIGLFDLQIPENGNISGDPFATVLKLTNGSLFANLDATMFDATSDNNALYAAVNLSGGRSWFGATTSSCTGCSGSDGQQIPEPASLLLLGTGGLGLLAKLRRRKHHTHA